jgi:hypothetical protein
MNHVVFHEILIGLVADHSIERAESLISLKSSFIKRTKSHLTREMKAYVISAPIILTSTLALIIIFSNLEMPVSTLTFSLSCSYILFLSIGLWKIGKYNSFVNKIESRVGCKTNLKVRIAGYSVSKDVVIGIIVPLVQLLFELILGVFAESDMEKFRAGVHFK